MSALARIARPITRTVAVALARSHGAHAIRSASWWTHVPQGPKDPILGVTEAFKEDKDPRKMNLGVGAYRDDNNKPVVIRSVEEAARRLHEQKLNNEYAPIAGEPEFSKHAVALAFGADHPLIKENRLAAIQSISGTGALRLAGAYIARFWPKEQAKPTVYLPNPTWGNHIPIFNDAGLQTAYYKYYKPSTKGLDLEGVLADIAAAPEKSVFLFHACAHNPTGVDPTPEQWKQISAAIKKRGHFVILDSAYQGFASGDPVKDTLALRQFAADGHQFAVAQSFSKNFGLYGQRVGCLSIVTESPAEKSNVESQLKILARAMYSNPPIHGARIVTAVLGDPALRAQWERDVREMAERIIRMRKELRDELERLGSKHNWEHITSQIGMFCYSGLTGEQVDRLTSEYHIYLTRNGRISMAGVTSKDIKPLAKAIHEVSQ